jgi:hypothetical protein
MGLDFVRKFKAVPFEKFDAVVLIRVVRGGDDHPGVGPHGVSDKRDPRGGHGAQQHDIHAHGADARGDGILQQVTGQTRVFAHHNGGDVRVRT